MIYSSEIVERIFDKVKDDLIHTTSSLGPDRPVYISVTTPIQHSFSPNKQTTSSISTSTESVLSSSTKDSSLESDELIDTSKVYLLGEQQIPQHVFESLKQVIHDHVTEHIIESTTTTEMPSTDSDSVSEVYATRKSSLRTTTKPKSSSSSSSSRKRTSTTTTSTPKSTDIRPKNHKNDDYKEDDSNRPIWTQNWPPNLSYLTLLRNRKQNGLNKTNYYDDPLIKSQSTSSFNKSNNNSTQQHQPSQDKQHALSFTITSYLAETSTSSSTAPSTTTQSPYRRSSNRFRSERNQSKNNKQQQSNKQNVDLYLVHDSNGKTEIHKTTNDVHLAASLQSVKHVDQFESLKEKKVDHLLDDTTGFINDNFLRHINQNDLLPNRTSSLIPVQGKQTKSETLTESYQKLPNAIKQYQKQRNSLNPADLMPETTCLREGEFLILNK